MYFCELAHIVQIQRVAEDGMVRAASQNPRFGGGRQIRLRLPQRVSHRQFRQGVRRFYGVNAVDQQAVTIAEVDQAGDDRRAGIENIENAEVLDVEDRFLFHRDGGTHFQHVRAEHQIVEDR